MKRIYRRLLLLFLMVFPLIVSAGEMCSEKTSPETQFIKTVLLLIQFSIPLLLIIAGLIDLLLAFKTKDSKLIKKRFKGLFIKVIIGIVVFFGVLIIKLGLAYITDSKTDDSSVIDCWGETEKNQNNNNKYNK